VVKVTNSTPETVNRGQRIMAYLIAILVVLSLASFIAVIAGSAMGALPDAIDEGLWPAVLMLPWFALPSAMLLTIALLIISSVTRKNANKAS
jgi:hypothetical protein